MGARWRAGIGLGVIAAAMALAGCSGGTEGAPTDSAGTQVLKIGFITPLTGPSASTGIDALDGAQTAVDIWNEQGLLPGYKVELVTEDDAGTPETGAIAYQKLHDQGIDIITGTMNSSVAIAVANAVSADPDVLYFISGAQSQVPLDEQTGDMIFGLTHTNQMYADANLGWIKDVAKPAKVAVLAENSDFGVAETAQIESHWTDGQPKIVMKETFDRSLTDFSSLLSKVRDSGADGLYVAAASTAIPAAIFTQADQLGLDVRKFINAGLMSPALVEAGGKAVDGITSADIYHYSLDNPDNKTFVDAFKKKHDKTPSALNSLGYDSMGLILGAVKEAGSPDDTHAVAKALRSGTWTSTRGELTFDDTGRALTDTLIIGIENGELTLVDTVKR